MHVCMYVCMYVCLNACIFGPSSNVNSSMTTPTSHVNSSTTRPFSHVSPRVTPKTGGKTARKDIRVIYPKAGAKTSRKDVRVSVSRRQEAKPSGKTSELSQGRSQKHQERHQSYANSKEADIKSSTKNTSIKASKSSPKVLLSHCSRVDVKRRMRNTNIKSSKSSPKVLLSHCSRVDVKSRIRNTNIKSSKSCHAVLCHTEKTHLQPQTTQCLTTFDPGPCDRSALFARPVAQAWPPPSLWMASTLRRFSSVKPVQHRLQTLMASNPPLPNHRQPRSRCANLLRSSLVTNSR